MTNLEKYHKAFIDTFDVSEGDIKGLEYQSIQAWDSVGHMNLMVALEEEFDIEMDIDDITDFSSYTEGKKILSKYNVEVDS